MRHLVRQIVFACALVAATPLIPATGADAAGGGGEIPPRWKPVAAKLAGIERLVREAERGRSPARPHFPIDGGHDYGESGALFGASRGGRAHEGQDVFAPAGTPLVAVRDGRVVETGNDGGRGNYIAIYAPGPGQTYVYLHMNEPARFEAGERVRGGQRIGSVGCTGSCWGDHLHFEIRQGKGPYGRAHDPLPALKRWDRR